MGFPNKAGDHADTDDILRAELKAAGIPTLQDEGVTSDVMLELLREQSGEVKTSVRGCLHGWTFERAWYYWMCKGPGIEIAAAERLQATHGQTVRASGDCACRGPRFWFKGLACGSYHVDDAAGLKALADTIRSLVEGSAAPGVPPVEAPSSGVYVECRECSECGHTGINDLHQTVAACNSCGWSGPEPAKDHCPACDSDGTMTAACPKCCGRYTLVAEATVGVDTSDGWRTSADGMTRTKIAPHAAVPMVPSPSATFRVGGDGRLKSADEDGGEPIHGGQKK